MGENIIPSGYQNSVEAGLGILPYEQVLSYFTVQQDSFCIYLLGEFARKFHDRFILRAHNTPFYRFIRKVNINGDNVKLGEAMFKPPKELDCLGQYD